LSEIWTQDVWEPELRKKGYTGGWELVGTDHSQLLAKELTEAAAQNYDYDRPSDLPREYDPDFGRRPRASRKARTGPVKTFTLRVSHRALPRVWRDIEIAEDDFTWRRNRERVAMEASLDGIYVIRSNVAHGAMDAEALVRAYKGLAHVERAFRSLKTVDLKIRPIFHRLESRVRAHVFLCMLAYYVEWHMREALGPLLFDDTDKDDAEADRSSIVAPARRSASAREKDHRRRTPDDLPVQSFRSLLRDLSTLTRSRVRVVGSNGSTFDKDATPTRLQARAFDLLGVSTRV
jgi:hypothetical protein